MFCRNFSKSLIFTLLALLVSFSLFNLPANANFDSRTSDIQDNLELDSGISVAPFSSGTDKKIYNTDKSNFADTTTNFLSTSVLDKYQAPSSSKPHILSSSVLSELEQTPKNSWKNQIVRLVISFDPSSKDVQQTLTFSYGATVLSNIPIAFVTTTLNNVFELSTLSGVKGVYLDQYYQFVDPSWKQMDENVLTYPSEAGITGSGIKIAIIDTGIDKYHSDLDDFDNDPSTNDPKVIAEMSFIDYDNDGINDTDAMDEFGHGTHCAGIAAANGSLQGVAPGAYLINARALDAFGGAYVSWVVNAIDWAVSQGADVISMSIGWMPGDIVQLLNEASDAAWESGSMVVVAAGNSGPFSGTISSPGMASRAITVGASDMFNGTTYWSSRGPSTNGLIDPDVVAPGAGILSTIPYNMYEVYSGTSMATPAVAGVVALLKSVFPSVDIDLIRSAILSTATDMGRSVFEQGAGMVNALEAYNYLSDPQAFVFPSFTETSPLKLSPNEILTYQLDIFVEQVYNSLTLEPSTEILPYVSTSFIDSPDSSGWIRVALTITMPDVLTIGSIIVKNGSTTLYEVPLTLEPEEEANDANASADAGETLSGAISLEFGVSYAGELKYGDLQDFYKFPVVEGKNYSLVLTNLERDIDLLLTDENGTVIAFSINYGLDDEQIDFTALSSGDYYARVVAYDFGYYTIQVSETDSLLSTTKVNLTGNYNDFGFDSDSDGLYDNLTITVEVEVNEAGTYDFLYAICQNRDDYIFPKYYVASGWNTIYLEEGIQTVELSIDGGSIEQSNYDGDYILSELLIGDPTTWMVIEYLRDDYITSSYTHSQFDPPEARLSSISYSQENLDSAGGPELFTIQCSFDIELEGEVNVVFWLINSQHLFGVFSETSVMGPLTTDVIFEFSGYNLLQILKGDIVVAGVVFISENYLFFLPIYDTKPSSEFSTYEPLYTLQITDKVMDYDSNGLYDTLIVDILVDSKVSTEVELYYNQLLYSLPAEKMVPSSGYGEYIQQTISEGKNHIYFEYSLTSAGARELSGPYLIPIIVLTDLVYKTIFTTHHVSNQYDYNTFDTPTAYLSKFLGCETVLSEFGGLKLTFEVIAKQELDVTISVDIDSYYSLTETYFYFWDVFEEHIYAGKNNISIIIPYQELFWYKFVGDLIVRQISIISWTSEDTLYDQIIIHDVNYLEFSSLFDAYFEGTYDFEYIDNDADSLYEGVNFTFPVYINKAGNYEFTLFLSSGYSIPYSITIREYYVEGKNFVSFVVPASAIVRSASSNNRLGIHCSLNNLESYWTDEFTDTFEVKDINDFDYILPLTYYKFKSVSSFDNNSDGLFDGINIDLQLNVSTTGTYYLDLCFSTLLFGGSYVLDAININTQSTFNSPGINDISLTIYSYDLLSTNFSLSYFDSTEFELNLDAITIYDNLGEYTIFINEKIPKTFDITDFDISSPVEIIAVSVDLEDFTGDSAADYLVFTIDYVLNKPMSYVIFELNIEISYLVYGIEYNIFYGTVLGFYPEVGEDSVEFKIELHQIFYDIPDEFEMSYLILVENSDYEIITYYSSDRETFNTIIDASTPTPTNTTPTEPTKNDFSMLISFAVIFILGVFFLKKKKK